MKKEMKQKALPKGWREVRLKNVASVKTGPFGAQLHQHDYVQSNGTPIITVEHLSERGLIHKNLPLVSDHDKERLNQYLIQEGDIVFSRVGSVDRSTLVSKDEVGWLFSGRLLRVRPKKCDVHSSYLNYFFHAQKFRHHMQNIAVGGTMPSINTSILSNVIIHLPPMNEQKAIASLLETWDTAIEKTEALIAAKEKRFKWLLKTLISDQQNNPEWRKMEMEKVACIAKKKALQKLSNKKLLTVKLHCRGVEINKTSFNPKINPKGRPYFERKNGEFLIGRQNFHNGGFGIVPLELDGYIASNAITSINLNPDRVNTDFLFYSFSRKNYYQRIGSFMDGTGQKELSDKQILQFSLSLPPLSQQKQIAQTLNAVKQEIEVLKQLNDQYRTQKRGLMQKLLKGKWRMINQQSG